MHKRMHCLARVLAFQSSAGPIIITVPIGPSYLTALCRRVRRYTHAVKRLHHALHKSTTAMMMTGASYATTAVIVAIMVMTYTADLCIRVDGAADANLTP